MPKLTKADLLFLEAQGAGGFSALLRAGGKKKKKKQPSVEKIMCARRFVSESAMPLEAVSNTDGVASFDRTEVHEGPMVRVVLISEGLGNHRDMNYYGPEAMDSAPKIFEGSHCFLNHPSFTEERDIPERRVQDMCGYFKNVNVMAESGVRSVVAELHFDLSESGRMAYEKCCTALHYKQEFPGSDKEYIGLSVNANGASEEREMPIEGKPAKVNYVKQFTEAVSCDIVTLPARGGKILALVESSACAEMETKEGKTMIVKSLQAEQARLKEAMSLTKEEKVKTLLTESLKSTEALLKSALDAANRSKKNREADASEADAEEADAEEADAEESADDEQDGDGIPEPGHTLKKTTTVSHKKDKAADDEEEKSEESEKMESNRLAVKQLIAESGLEKELFDVQDMARRGLTEAKREISRMKRVSEAWTRKAMKVIGDVSPAHAAKFNESGKGGSGAVDNTDLFAGCSH